MTLNGSRSPLKSIDNNRPVVSPSKNRFIDDEKLDLPPPSASSGGNLKLVSLSPIRSPELAPQEPPRARLVIEKLVLTNFKSYVGVQEVGPFHSSFSAVVGPNGSGKSNVIDSMLFVFGFRASKMRQAKLSELIHNSEKHQNLSFCSVDIHFVQVKDMPDGTTITIPNQDTVVTRKAYRNNSSDYFINGKKSSYTEVTSMLKDQGIDLDHKRFLILQGEVESIAQMKPKAEKENDDGLLEYLEDIIGTAEYKGQIESNLEKVDELNEVCLEKENRFELVEQRKDSLESDKNKALQFLKLERDSVLKKNQLIQAKILKRKHQNKDNIKKRDEVLLELKEKRESNAALSEDVTKLESEYSHLQQKAKRLNESIVKLQKSQRSVDKERVKFDEQKKNLTNKSKKNEKIIETAETLLKTSTVNLETQLKYQSEFEKDLEIMKSQLDEENAELQSIRKELANKTKPFTDRISEIQKQLEPWKEKISAKNAEIKLAESNVRMIEEEFASLDKELETKQKQKERISREGESLEERTSSLKKEKTKVAKQIHHGSTEVEKANKKLKEMRETLHATRLKAVDVRNAFSKSQNKSKVLSGLMRLQKSGRISGFHGRLGDLGIIDDEYDVAISTACSQLDDMVVDTVEIGQQCINFLRSQNLGYARFICLNKLKQFNMSSKNTPLNCLRLFDLITPKDDKFLPAFYSVVRDTLVAPDLKTANKAAYGFGKRNRVVTIDGKLIDTSGTLSGGGNYAHRGGMKTKSNSNLCDGEMMTPEDVETLSKELAIKEKHFQSAQDSFREMEDALKSLNEREPEIDLQLSKIDLEKGALEDELKSCQKTIETLKMSKKSTQQKLEKDLKAAKSRVSRYQEELGELKSDASDLENKLKEYEEKIMEIGGVNLRMQTSKIDGLNQKIEILNEKSSSTLHTIKKLQNEINRNEKVLSNNQKEMESIERDLKKLEKDFKDKNLNTAEIEKQIDALTDAKEELKSEMEEVKESLSEKQAEINEFKSSEIELENDLEKYETAVKHEQGVLKGLEKALASLELRRIGHLVDWLDYETNKPKLKPSGKGRKKRKRIESDEDDNEDDNGREADAVEKIEEEDEDSNHNEFDEKDVDMNSAKEEDSSTTAENSEGEEDGENRSVDFEELKELFTTSELPSYSDEELSEVDCESLSKEIEEIDKQLDTMKVDVEILEEYGRRAIEYHKRKLDLNAAIGERDNLRDYVEELRKKRLSEFMKGFYTISMTLKEMYQMITMGGNAELELVDSLDPFAEGILFSVMPPKKSWRNISNLSGGEKTLSSLALVFALHKYKPTPLYVMDEIDAALDFRNVSIVANYIKERTKNAQFIVISLRNNMFELSRRLVGIYKVDNMTRSVTLDNKEIL